MFFSLMFNQSTSRIHIMIDIIIEKVIFLRIQDIITEYGSSRFSANFSEIRESNMLASFPIPPLTEKTNGVKVPFSICKIRSLYFVSSPFHLTCNIAVGFCYHTTWRLRQESLRKKILYGIYSKISRSNVQPNFISHIR